MNFPFYIARRYLFSRKSHNAINVISAVSVCGVALATLALVCTLSVFNGFRDMVSTFFTAFDPQLRVVPAVGKVFDGKMLLIAIANGCFCGGGVKGVPKALTDDGFMDISLVRKCSRRRFIQLFPKYAKGEHLNAKGADKLIIYRKAKTLKITANGEPFTFSTDGELTKAKEIEFEIVPGAVDFVVPQQIESNK